MLLKTDPSIIASYFEDHSGLRGGTADLVCFPERDDDVAAFLRESSEKKRPVTIAGAGTGVTGGRVPFGGAVLSLELMNRIIDVRSNADGTGTAVVDPGVAIQALKAAADEQGLMYAPDPTEPTAWIGGNVATNASGSRGYKYGPTRRYVQALRVVLSTGKILNIRRGQFTADNYVIHHPAFTLQAPRYRLPNIKNAAGYYAAPDMDLIDLFIGQEGTIGVITRIEVGLLPARRDILAGIAFFHEERSSWGFVQAARHAVDALSFEYFDRFSLDLLRGDYPNIPAAARAAIYFEQEVSPETTDAAVEQWHRLLTAAGARMDEVWFSAHPGEQKLFREFRHALPEKVNEIVKRTGLPKVGTDIAVPAACFEPMMNAYRTAFESSGMQHLIFGHIGECHLHANILPSTEEQYVRSRVLYQRLAAAAVELGGTVSAEHGVGKLKHPFLEAMIGRDGMREIARVKAALDPACILGRNNIIPDSLLP